MIIKGCWFNIVVLNFHAPRKDEIYVLKGSFYEELERVFDKLPKYHIKMLLGDFSAKVGIVDFFELTIGNESLHEISNHNGVGIVNFDTSKHLSDKGTMFPHQIYLNVS
jgi:hypothetical protein